MMETSPNEPETSGRTTTPLSKKWVEEAEKALSSEPGITISEGEPEAIPNAEPLRLTGTVEGDPGPPPSVPKDESLTLEEAEVLAKAVAHARREAEDEADPELRKAKKELLKMKLFIIQAAFAVINSRNEWLKKQDGYDKTAPFVVKELNRLFKEIFGKEIPR